MADLTNVYSAFQKADAAGDTAGAKQLADYIRAQGTGTPTDTAPAPSLDPSEYDPTSQAYQAKYGATAGNTGLQNFIAGYGRSIYNLARGVGENIGAISPQDVVKSREMDAPLLNTGGGKWGNIVGTGVNLLPAAFVPGANSIAGSAAIGEGIGLLQPYADKSEQERNTLLGGILSPLSILGGRAVAAGYQGLKGVVSPFFQGGQEGIAARTMAAAAGGPQEAALAAQRIGAGNASAIPGYEPTTAELAQNAGLSQLERTLKNNPDYLTQMTARMQSNRAALTQAVSNIGGDDLSMAAAESARDAAAKPLYQAARSASAPVDEEMTALLQRPSMQNAVSRASRLAAEKGQTFGAGAASAPRGTTFQPIAAGDSLGPYVSGSEISNTSSIGSSLEGGYTVEPGIQKVPLSEFYEGKPPGKSYSASENARTADLASQIKESGRMDPLIVVRDGQGSYVLEGGHRLDAAYQIPGATHVPAMVVRESGVAAPGAASMSGTDLQYLKMSLQDMANTGFKQGMGAHELGAIKSTLSDLNAWTSANVPDLRAADAAFRSGSVPINQMEIGQALSQRLNPALADFGGNTRLNAASYANALRNGDALAARTTGFRGATLESTMSPDQLGTLNSVARTLAQRANADELGKAVGSNTAQNLISQNMLRQMLGPLGLPAGWAERGAQSTLLQSATRPIQWAGQIGQDRVLGRLAQAALSPEDAQRLLSMGAQQQIPGYLMKRQALFGLPALTYAAQK